MPTETEKHPNTKTEKEINTKEDMVRASSEIAELLPELLHDVNTCIVAPRGQANLAEHAREALDRMTRLANELVGMPESSFAMIPESEMTKKLEERKAREKVRVEREKEKEKERLEKEKEKHAGATGPTGPTGPARETPDAQRHQSRQHV